ncbi:MAG: PAS domain-containing protein [Candidatus Obscuribacterales bacterium]|nr:PAS domain-containing protein [Candidatus Obscuribacterales bacterium]
MGLTAKLNFAFITVIVVMVISSAALGVFNLYKSVHDSATEKLETSKKQLGDDMLAIANGNERLALSLLESPGFNSAYSSKNKDRIGREANALIDRAESEASVIVVDDHNYVVYSSETPSKSGYPVPDQGFLYNKAISTREKVKGSTTISVTGAPCITAIVPIPYQGGAVIVTQAINLDLLTGFVTKMALMPAHITNVDAALYSAKDKRVTVITTGLLNKDGGYLDSLSKGTTPPLKVTEVGDKMYWPFLLFEESPEKDLVGIILITTPVADIKPQLMGIGIQSAVSAILALLLALFFANSIGTYTSSSIKFLIQRAKDLAAQKSSLPALDVLKGEFLELGELMDTAVASLRSSVQSLKTQLLSSEGDSGVSVDQLEAANSQINTLNRQVASQTRQIAETAKQINYANQQAVLLQQKLDSVIQIANEGFLFLDQFGNIVSANPAFLNWLGSTEAEVAGRYCYDLVKKPGDPPDGDATAFSKRSNEPGELLNAFFPEGFIYHRQQKRVVEVFAHLQPIMQDNTVIQGYILVLRDKTLHTEAASLRQEIVTFLTDSIRTPLSSAEPTWNALLANASQTMHASVGQGLAQLHTHYVQLLAVVDSLLMIYGGTIPSSTTPREPTVITRLVADCLEEVSALARERQLMLDYKTVTGLPTVNSDKDVLRNVIVELLRKMLDITAPGGRIRVESVLKANEVRMSVSSSGPALSTEDVNDMFVGFIQGKHPEDSYASRLAMYVVRNNIERIGGRIWAESESGRGTLVYFTLPAG